MLLMTFDGCELVEVSMVRLHQSAQGIWLITHNGYTFGAYAKESEGRNALITYAKTQNDGSYFRNTSTATPA